VAAGTATSTVSCPLGRQGNDKPDIATVIVVVNASSTATKLDFFVEESLDNIDWFPIAADLRTFATSTLAGDELPINIRPFFSAVFASTTIGQTALGASDASQGLDGSDNRNHYMFDIPVRLEYVRVIGVAAPTSTDDCTICEGDALLWMHIIPKISL